MAKFLQFNFFQSEKKTKNQLYFYLNFLEKKNEKVKLEENNNNNNGDFQFKQVM